MRRMIKNTEVAGVIKPDGRCPNPNCNRPIIVNDKEYRFIKNDGIAEFNTGEDYIKCKNCGLFVGRPKVEV